MKLRLVTNKLGSSSLKQLGKALSSRVGYKVFRSHFPKNNRTNIYYGDCKDKLFQYNYFKNNHIPALEFTTSVEDAKAWAKACPVFARKLLSSSQGKGIVICETPEQVVLAPVYTKYKKKKREFRVHIYKENVVSVLEKRKRKGFEGERESRIRNLANGYVFCSDNVVEPNGLRELALRAAKVTNSDFKGIDVGYNEKKNELFVIEVNSAPGIEGSNLSKYVEAIVV